MVLHYHKHHCNKESLERIIKRERMRIFNSYMKIIGSAIGIPILSSIAAGGLAVKYLPVNNLDAFIYGGGVGFVLGSYGAYKKIRDEHYSYYIKEEFLALRQYKEDYKELEDRHAWLDMRGYTI